MIFVNDTLKGKFELCLFPLVKFPDDNNQKLLFESKATLSLHSHSRRFPLEKVRNDNNTKNA